MYAERINPHLAAAPQNLSQRRLHCYGIVQKASNLYWAAARAEKDVVPAVVAGGATVGYIVAVSLSLRWGDVVGVAGGVVTSTNTGNCVAVNAAIPVVSVVATFITTVRAPA